MLSIQTIATIFVIVAAILLFLKILSIPIRFIFRLLLNTLLGFVLLVVLDSFAPFIGIQLGINWTNALIAGVLGLPGIGLLLALKWLL